MTVRKQKHFDFDRVDDFLVRSDHINETEQECEWDDEELQVNGKNYKWMGM